MDNEQQPNNLNQQSINPQPLEPIPVQPLSIIQPTQPVMTISSPVTPVVSVPSTSHKMLIIIIAIVATLIISILVIILVIINNKPESGLGHIAPNIQLNQDNKNQRVGNNSIGYITVPKTWVRFTDIDNPDIFQYSDGTEDYIVTMSARASGVAAKEVANNIWENFANEGAENIDSATVKIGKYTAYQVYGYYPDEDKILVTWSFEDENDKLHYVSIEATTDKANADNMNAIANTFSLEK